jgi:hypothetical protein
MTRSMTRWKAAIAAAGLLLLLGCARERGGPAGVMPIGGPPVLRTAMTRALHGAEPDGLTLVVLWTLENPPPLELQDISKRWSPHGLVTLGVCIEALGDPPRDAALGRVRAWMRRGRPGIPSIAFDGDAASLANIVTGAGATPGMILLDPQGHRIWAADGLSDLDALEAILDAHLGEPNVADDGCTCTRAISGGARAARAAG